jgi:hypothetical protein
LVEKFFSVSVEFNDGTTKAVAARGESHGLVYQQIKQMPGVRRVGKVAEVSPGVHEAVKHGRPSAPDPEPRRPRPIETGVASLNQPLRGPRVVLDARPTGGEQPFKHLQAPPERPKPPQPAVQQQPPARRVEPAMQPVASQARAELTKRPEPAPAQPELAEPGELEYRIVRSRRAGGPSYLLQRGTWFQRDGKRIFKLDWEKGFDDRAKAEHHLEWVQQSAQELADVEEDEPAEDESQLTPELAEV